MDKKGRKDMKRFLTIPEAVEYGGPGRSALYEANKSGDAIKAGRIHRAHRTHAKEIIVDLLEKHRLHLL